MSGTRKPKESARPLPPGITRHHRGGYRVVASSTIAGDRRRLVRIERGDLNAAKRLQRKLYDELGEALGVDGAGDSLAALCARYADDRERLGRAESYVVEMRRKVTLLAETALGRRPASLVSAGELDALYARLDRDGLGASGVRAWHALISGALSAGVRWGELDRNPAKSASPPPEPRPTGVAPEPELARRYLDAVERANPTLGVLLRVAALTGARRGELCALRWGDLDVERSTLKIHRSLTSPKGERYAEGTTKTGRKRTIELSPEALAELVAHRARRESLCHSAEVELDARRGFVFGPDDFPHGSKPYRPDYVSRRSRELAELAGLPVAACHPHGLRHYFATQGLAAGGDVKSMASYLGHDAAMLLDVYAHAVDDAERAAAVSVGRTLGR
jgi:integrase